MTEPGSHVVFGSGPGQALKEAPNRMDGYGRLARVHETRVGRFSPLTLKCSRQVGRQLPRC